MSCVSLFTTCFRVAHFLALELVKRDFDWLQFEEDFDIIAELERLLA
jgi:hypothetical protein